MLMQQAAKVVLQHARRKCTLSFSGERRPAGEGEGTGESNNETVTHTSRFNDPATPEQTTPGHALSHGSLPVVWFCHPVLAKMDHDVLPLVAINNSTSAAR
jgi:hypothetical protein